MTLDALIRGAPKAQPVGSATAIPATAPTEEGGKTGAVAVADPENAKTEGTEAHAEVWWRVGITEPGGRTIEVDAPSGWTLREWSHYGDRYHGPGCSTVCNVGDRGFGPGCTLAPIAQLPKARAPVNLDEALRAACAGVEGITPAQFRGLLSPEDVVDIEAGGIHPKTLRAYALSFAEGLRSGRIGVPGELKTPSKIGSVSDPISPKCGHGESEAGDP